jgi:hypothetical protein
MGVAPMPVSTDRFKVTSLRPSAQVQYEGVPQDLTDKVEGMVFTVGQLEELGVDVKTARLYHGGDGIAVIYWHGEEYVLNLEPAPQ